MVQQREMISPKPTQAPASLPGRVKVTVGGLCRGLRSSVLTVHVKGKIRRFYLLHFRPAYVRRHLLRRRGEWAQCGACCSLGNACPCLEHPSRRCLIYLGLRPRSCCVFPIDERDLRDVGPHCGYYFDGMTPPKPVADCCAKD